MGANLPANEAQNAGNLPVFKALQRWLAVKVAPSRSDATRWPNCHVKSFDRSWATLCKPFLALEPSGMRKNIFLIESRP